MISLAPKRDDAMEQVLARWRVHMLTVDQLAPSSADTAIERFCVFLAQTAKRPNTPLSLQDAREKTLADVTAFFDRTKATRSRAMRVRDRTHLRNAYDFLMGAGLVAANPVNVDIPRERGTSKRGRLTASEENIQQFLEVITQRGREEWERWRDRAIFLLYYRARLFPVDVARAIPKHLDGDKLLVHSQRAAKMVRITLDQETHEAIQHYVSALPIDLPSDAALFRAGPDLLPLDPKVHFSALSRLGKRRGLPSISSTVLRNSSVAHALARGVDVESLRRASGLKSLEGVQDLGPALDEAQVFTEFRSLHPRW